MIKKIKSRILIPVKIVVSFFIIFFSVITSIFLYLLILFSIKDVKIDSGYIFNGLKKVCNFKLGNYNIDFASIDFKKTPITDFKFNFSINNILLKHNSGLQVLNLDKLQLTSTVGDLLTGYFVPIIDGFSNTEINIPVNYSAKNNNNVRTSKNNEKIVKTIQNLSKIIFYITRHINKTERHRIDFSNIKFNLVDLQNHNVLYKFLLLNSNFSVLQNDLKQNTSIQKSFIERLKKNKNLDSNNILVRKYYSMKNAIYSDEQYIWNNIRVKQGREIFEFIGICDNESERRCVVDINNFPVQALDIQNKMIKNFDIKSKLYGTIFANIGYGGISNIDVYAKIIPNNTNIAVKNNDKVVDKISLKVKATNNFSTINQLLIIINDDAKDIIKFDAKNLVIKNGVVKNGLIDVKFDDVLLSNFYNFLSNKMFFLKKINSFDGIINGNISLKIMPDGSMKTINNAENGVTIKKLIINSKQYDYDLSKILFSLEQQDEKMIFRIIDKDKQQIDINNNNKDYILLTYDTKTKDIIFNINNLIISEDYFIKLKKTLLTQKQLELTKTFTYSAILNGEIHFPKNSSFAKNGYIDLKFDILAKDYDDIKDDEVIVKVNKQKGRKTGKILFDFGKSRMRSELYNLTKQEKDKMYIDMDFDMLPKERKFDIKFDGSWNFNHKKVSLFNIYAGEKSLDIRIKSPRANMIVLSNDMQNYNIHLFGDRIHLDYDFWHIILFGITLLEGEGLLKIDVDNVANGRINELYFKNFDFHLGTYNNFFLFGRFDCDNYYHKHKDLGNIHLLLHDGVSEIDIKNMIPLLTLMDIKVSDIPMQKISLKGKGVHNMANRIIHFDNLKVKFDDYKGVGIFDYTRLKKVKIKDLTIFPQDLFCRDINIEGNNFDGSFDLDMNINGKTKLEGNFIVKSAFRILKNIKSIFVSDEVLTPQSGGVKLLKKGETFDEFVRHMEINGKDFSADKDGNQKISLTLISEALSK